MSAGDDKTPNPYADVEIYDVTALIDAHIEGDSEFGDDVPTLVEVRHICPGCGKDQVRLEETEQPPASHEQAWRRGPLRNGKPLWDEGACRGNKTYYWCKSSEKHGYTGMLVIVSLPGQGGMFVQFFPDRRIEARPVAVERRGLPPGTPKGSK